MYPHTDMNTHTRTVDRLPPGEVALAILQVDGVVHTVTHSVPTGVVGQPGVTLETLI